MRSFFLMLLLCCALAACHDLGRISRDVGTGAVNVLTLGDAGRPRRTDAERCAEYGFAPGTEVFAHCLLELETARRNMRRVRQCHPVNHHYGPRLLGARCY